jgi:hypothetical protein
MHINHAMNLRRPRTRAYAPDPDAPGQTCDLPGCAAPGEYRAPKSPLALRDYWWFCLEHVRAYNAAWDYCKGMTPGEIEAQLRADTGWQRPTWPLGRLGGVYLDETELLRDPLGELGAHRREHERRPQPPAELREPLSTFGLAWPTTLEAVKARYKELAKAHHPDANGGNRAAEERLKLINLAYAALRSRLSASPGLSAAG